jgi:hypothetical protein
MELAIQLIIMGTMGTICSFVAPTRGRSALGWFFIGFFFSCLGLIVLLVIPDLKKLEAEKQRMLAENRRLREQVKLNREVADRQHEAVASRLKAHDRALGVDTSQAPEAQMTSGENAPPAAPPPLRNDGLSNAFASKQWYFVDEAGTQGPVTFKILRSVWKSGEFPAHYYVRSADMTEWSTIEKIPGLREALDGQ